MTLVPDAIAKRWGIKGLVVGKVPRGSAAERAGIQGARETVTGRIELGDVIVGVGDRVMVEVLHVSRRQQVTVTLQAIE